MRLGCLLLAGLCAARLPAQSPADAVAVVNGTRITLGEVDAVLRARPRPLTPPTPSEVRSLRLEAASGLIDDLLLKQFLTKNAPPVTEAEVDRQIAALSQSQAAQGKTVEDYYRETGQTAGQVRAAVEAMLRLTCYLQQNVTGEQLKAYFEKNKPYFEQVMVRAGHIVIRTGPSSAAAEREQARAKLAALRGQIVAGTLTFEDAARAHSQCPSAESGGEIGPITRKWMVDEPFAEAAFALSPNQVSDVVETEFGVHLIRVTERTEPKPITFELAAESVKDCYLEETRQQLLKKLRSEANVSVTLP